MSGMDRRLKRLEADHFGTDDDWWDVTVSAINGDEKAIARIEAVKAAGGSPGYRRWEAEVTDLVRRARERERAKAGDNLSVDEQAQMGTA